MWKCNTAVAAGSNSINTAVAAGRNSIDTAVVAGSNRSNTAVAAGSNNSNTAVAAGSNNSNTAVAAGSNSSNTAVAAVAANFQLVSLYDETISKAVKGIKCKFSSGVTVPAKSKEKRYQLFEHDMRALPAN